MVRVSTAASREALATTRSSADRKHASNQRFDASGGFICPSGSAEGSASARPAARRATCAAAVVDADATEARTRRLASRKQSSGV